MGPRDRDGVANESDPNPLVVATEEEGGCTCSTCHCYVTDPWFERLPAPHPDELELLEFALERRPQSRLSCQIKLTAELDGLTVRLPSRQLPGDDRAVDGHAEKGKS